MYYAILITCYYCLLQNDYKRQKRLQLSSKKPERQTQEADRAAKRVSREESTGSESGVLLETPLHREATGTQASAKSQVLVEVQREDMESWKPWKSHRERVGPDPDKQRVGQYS